MNLKYLVLAAALAPAAASAQTALTTTNYTQNFDTLSSTTASSTVPAGFAFTELGANANSTYNVSDGSSNTGTTFSFGTTGSTERAFGSVASGNLSPVYFGFLFTNGLGSTITSFDFGYTGEQWRLGTSGASDNLVFQYSTNATSLTTGTWNAVTALNFNPIVTTGTAGELNGNLTANQRNLFATIGGLNILANQGFAFRWTDVDSSGSDHGLAIDDVRIISTLQGAGAVPEPATWAMMMLGFGAMGFAMRRRPTANARIRFA